MSQQIDKKNNLFFYISILIIILLFILGTLLAIKYKNESTSLKKENTHEFTDISLTFKKVEKAPTLDVLRKYRNNGITIDKSNKLKISGLKDKEIENKINKILSNLYKKETSCDVNLNISNVLSISCRNFSETIDLTTGNLISIEDVFNYNTNVKKILLDTLYENACLYNFNCYPDEDENYEIENNIEDLIVKQLNKIKKNKYSLAITKNEIILELDNIHNEINNEFETSIVIPISKYIDEITIFDRFITKESIYEKDEEECFFPLCEITEEKTEDEKYYTHNQLIDNKILLNSTIYNNTEWSIFNSNKYSSVNFDLKKLHDYLVPLTIDELNLKDTQQNRRIYLSIEIYTYKEGKYILDIQANITDMDFEDFKKSLTGASIRELKNYKSSDKYKINWVLDENENIIKYDNDLEKHFINAKENLVKYIEDDLKKPTSNFNGLYCHNNEDNFNICDKKDIEEIVDEAAYFIDNEEKIIYMVYIKNIPDMLMASSVRTELPYNIFESTEKNNAN